MLIIINTQVGMGHQEHANIYIYYTTTLKHFTYKSQLYQSSKKTLTYTRRLCPVSFDGLSAFILDLDSLHRDASIALFHLMVFQHLYWI